MKGRFELQGLDLATDVYYLFMELCLLIPVFLPDLDGGKRTDFCSVIRSS